MQTSSRLFFVFCALCIRLIAASPDATATLDLKKSGPVVNPNIYGQFAEHLGHGIYGGIWVGEDSPIPNARGFRNDVVAALRELHVPLIRWPGGCFADEYHWKDGIGPREKRPGMINNNWGGVVENNHFGTHEFMALCELVGAEPYISGNIGSGTVQEMVEWIEYMTSDADSPMANLRRAHGRKEPWKLKYFGFGNETWGCGGNMRPEFYADLFRQYSAFVKDYSGNHLYRIASGANSGDTRWTDVVMEIAGLQRAEPGTRGITLHYYTIPTGDWSGKGSATNFGEAQWFSTLKHTLHMKQLVEEHSKIMDRHDPEKKVGLLVDEWGTWTDVEPGTNPGFLFQQNSMRDALVAAINLHLFQQHADRVTMSAIAQMVNVLQAMILTDGPRMIRTPTYWVFEMLQVHQGGTVLPLELDSPDYTFGGESIPAVSGSATRSADGGAIHLSLANADPNRAITVTCRLAPSGVRLAKSRVLTAPTMTAHNTFDAPDTVRPLEFDGARLAADTLTVTLPPKSVVTIELR